MPATTHECPAPTCSARVPFSQLACRTHWRLVPADLRSALTRAWRNDFGSDDYFAARADCLKALGVPEAEIPGLNAGQGL